MFQIGDFVVHGTCGVCKVEAIGRPDIDMLDKSKKYYTLNPVYQKGSKIYTPVENDKVKMRKIMSYAEAEELIEEIPQIDLIHVEDDKYLQEKYKESIRKYDYKELVRIIKTIYINKERRIKNGKKLSTVEERYQNMAEEFLYGEMAMTLNIPKEQVEQYIKDKIDQVHE